MKFILSLFSAILCLSASAQTLVVSNNLAQINKLQAPCSPKYIYVGFAHMTNSSVVASNRFFYPTTNVLTFSFPSNLSARINASSTFGQSVCGQGFLTVTDIFYNQGEAWSANVYWSNNVIPVPTNQQAVMIMTGLRTNGP